MPSLISIPSGLGKAESAGDASPNVRDVLVSHQNAIRVLQTLPRGGDYAAAPLVLSRDKADRVTPGPESWVCEWMANLDGLAVSLRAQLSAEFEGTGTFSVRLGGTKGGVDGTPILTFSNVGGFFVADSEYFDNPGGTQRLKVTGISATVVDIFFPSLRFF